MVVLSFGEKIARHTEVKLGYPNGYLDTINSESSVPIDVLLEEVRNLFKENAISPEEKELIKIYRKVRKPQKALIASILKELSHHDS